MKVTIEFLHLDHTDSLDERITEKSEKFSKFFDREPSLSWTCFVKEGVHYAECTLRHSNVAYFAKAKADSLYKTIDMVCDKLEKQVVKKKEKVKNKIHRKRPQLVILEPDAAWGDFEAVHQEEEAELKKVA